MKDSVTKKTETFHQLVHSPDGRNSPNWARLRPAAGSTLVSPVSTGAQTLGLPFATFPGAFPGNWIRSGAAGLTSSAGDGMLASRVAPW